MKLKKGDLVIVLSGKDKGKKGEILKAMPSEEKVIVKGVNVVKQHQKPSQTTPGGIVEKELPILACKVAIVDPKTGKATKIGYKVDENGNKVRVAKKSQAVIESK
ncbi:MAG: 50S ribosomal protein L24 [Alphaproteobacteria bacterium ADurb.Bin438]|nr:MAG: 50S ribosomal protein L24 [Alphaproteobacteria bacterium ADurb.Bin438]